jgi:SAM-dependent methyltransferase
MNTQYFFQIFTDDRMMDFVRKILLEGYINTIRCNPSHIADTVDGICSRLKYTAIHKGNLSMTAQQLHQIIHAQKDFWEGYRYYKEIAKDQDDCEFIHSVTSGSSTILDFGCGKGYFGRSLSKMNHCVYGADPYLHKMLSEFETNERHLFREIERSDIPTISWDMAIFRNVLHHMRERDIASVLSDLCTKSLTICIKEDVLISEYRFDKGDRVSEYSALTAKDQRGFLAAIDFIGNRVISGDVVMPLPCNFKTEEAWCDILQTYGYELSSRKESMFSSKSMHMASHVWLIFHKR